MSEQRSVIVITADAWRADFAGRFEGVQLLDALAPLAGRCARFTRAYASSPWTSPSIVSMFTGESAPRHGVSWAWSAPRVGVASVGGLLGAGGWRVPALSYLTRVGNYHHLGWDAEDGPTGAEPSILLRAVEAMEGPTFLWFHYKWTHLPYRAEARWLEAVGVDPEGLAPHLKASVWSEFVVPREEYRFFPEDQDVVRRLYAAGVLQLNAWLREVVAALEARGLWETTTLVLTSDHGEELLERGHVGHASTAHHAQLFEESLRIPLFIAGAGVEGAQTCDARVWGVDLFPTLLELAGHPAPPSEGISLLPALRGEALPEGRSFTFLSARAGYRTPPEQASHLSAARADGRLKVILDDWGEVQRVAAYDLHDDPEERRPLPPPPGQEAALRVVTGGPGGGSPPPPEAP